MNKLYIQKLFLIISDLLSLIISLAISHQVLTYFRPDTPALSFNTLGTAKLVGLSIIAVFWYQEQYSKRRPSLEELRLLYKTIFIFALLHLCVSYLLAHRVIKLLNIFFWFIVVIALPLMRSLTKLMLLKFGLWQRNLYVIGYDEIAISNAKLLLRDKLLGYNLKNFVAVNSNYPDLVALDMRDIPVIGFDDFINIDKVDTSAEVVFILPSYELLDKINYINLLQSKYNFLSIIPDIYGLPIYGVELNHFFANEQLFLRLQNNLGRRFNYIIKRCIDFILAGCILLLLSPIFLMIILSLIIVNQDFRILYAHRRVGKAGVEFNCLKFRTMHLNSQQILAELLATNEQARLEWQSGFKLKNDPRVTKIGAFLRRTSLDELPQLFNVIKGQMSLIGPRPIITEEIERYQDGFYYYKLVRPGITGLWQISGRSDVDYAQRVRLDIWYVKNWSLWYDIVILLNTVLVVLKRSGAY